MRFIHGIMAVSCLQFGIRWVGGLVDTTLTGFWFHSQWVLLFTLFLVGIIQTIFWHKSK